MGLGINKTAGSKPLQSAFALFLAAAFLLLTIFSTQRVEASPHLPVSKADFWIERLENPDKPMLTQEQIVQLNDSILDENDEMADVLKSDDAVSKQELIDWLLKDPLPTDRQMFDKKGKPVKDVFYKALADNMNMEGIKESNELMFGVIVKRADIRAFPTDEPALKNPSAGDFDAFQYSAIFPPQPVALLHKSKDLRWGFFQTPFVRGWIRLDEIAFAKDKADIIPNPELQTPNFLVITGSKVNIFKQGAWKTKTLLETLPMGTSLSLHGENKKYWVVRFPEKDEKGNLRWIDAYIEKRADAHIGALPYTQKNVIKQAFKALGEKYGWGGRGGLRDCSSFIQDVFASMGINLPRHSSRQAEVGKVLIGFDESAAPDDMKTAMDSAVPGITLFGLHGHIMLYLGNVSGNYYTLHQLFGYYDKHGFRAINKVVVTNLELGKGSKAGAIRERIRSINLVIPDEVN